ncbi:MAG: hypothetical protein ACPGXK_03640, partial [Phycisphaerae bacterium]
PTNRPRDALDVLTFLIAALAILGAGLLVSPINRIRKERQLLVDPDSIAGLPPDIALLGKLGTLRALVIDYAAIRAENLKQEGKTYEALDLHKTICKLAPRFAKMWANAAWNMSYNISVMQYTPEARWQWVNNGIKILRDEGIPYNPRSSTLYREITWIYWHKVGGYLDDHQMSYKRALAVEMELVLGAHPTSNDAETYFAWFREVVDADPDVAALIDQDPGVAQFVSRLETLSLEPNSGLLEYVARNIRPELTVRDVVDERADAASEIDPRLALLTNPTFEEPRRKLLASLRHNTLKEDLKLDPVRMMAMMEKYGPIDWRNCFAHGFYWAVLGDEMAVGHEASDLSDTMNNARLIFFALQSMVTRGKVVLWPNFDDPFDSHLALTPDTRFIPYTFATYLELGKKHFSDHPEFKDNTPGPIYMNGFTTNMHTWIELLYLEGGKKNEALANQYYSYLREFNPHPDGSTQERYMQPISAFITSGIKERLLTYTAINGIVRGFVERGLKHFALGEREAGVRSISRSKLAYKQWMKDTTIDPNDRRKLQPPEVILEDQVESYLRDARYAAIYKSRLWRALPLDTRQMVYDRLRPYFVELCAAQDPAWTAAKAFPEPVGMEKARKEERYLRNMKRKDIEQGEKIIDY